MTQIDKVNFVFGNKISINQNNMVDGIKALNDFNCSDALIQSTIEAWILLKFIKVIEYKPCQEPNKHYGIILPHYQQLKFG